MVGVPTGQDAQLVPDHVVVQADAAGLPVNFVSLRELFRWDLLQAGLGKSVPPLSPAVLDALEDHDAEHDDEADAHDDGEGKEVGVDVKRLVVS